MSKILVTGAGGYIGSHITKQLLKDGHKVVALDNFSRGYQEPLKTLEKYGSISVLRGDLTKSQDLKKVFTKHRIDLVIHLAAYCLVDESMKNPAIYFKNNVFGTLNLLEAMKESGVKKIIFSSTCAVYGDAKYLPINEKHPTLPTNPYGESKLMAEKLIQWFAELFELKYIIFRFFNVCGADSDGEIGDSKKPSELLVQNLVRGALGIEEFKLTCSRVNTPDSTPIRDFIDVLDLVSAHKRAIQHLDKSRANLILNLGNGKGWSVRQILKAVEKELGVAIAIKKPKVLRKGDPAKVVAERRKAKNVLNWEPKISIEESIRSLKNWYQKKPYGYKK